MLNEKKIRLMTKLAVYEDKAGKEDLKLSKYYKMDYVRYQLLKAVLSVTVGFVLILALLLFYKSEYIIAEAVKLDYQLIGTYTLGIYLILIVIYGFASIVAYSFKFDMSRKKMAGYMKNLKLLRNFYREEEKESK